MNQPRIDPRLTTAARIFSSGHRFSRTLPESILIEKDYGILDRPKPQNPFAPKNGTSGGWEVALWYSSLDLSETPDPQAPPVGRPLPIPQIAGEISDITPGVSWHLNNYTRLMFNYVTSELKDGSMGITNDADIYMARFQVDW
jgi:phosphate-selective porin